jgi:hypothetical protein
MAAAQLLSTEGLVVDLRTGEILSKEDPPPTELKEGITKAAYASLISPIK